MPRKLKPGVLSVNQPSVVWNAHEHRMWYQTWEGLACADLDVLE